jgi:hypothetical protein
MNQNKLFTADMFKQEMDQKPIIWPDGWQLMADVANKILEINDRPPKIINVDNYPCTREALDRIIALEDKLEAIQQIIKG